MSGTERQLKEKVFKVTPLQRNCGMTFFGGATNFLTKNAPKISPKLLSLYLVGPKNPQNAPQISRCKKLKNHRRASAGAQAEKLLGRTSRGCPGGCPGGRPGPKIFTPHRSERRKIKFFGRTSLIRRRGRPSPEGVSENFLQENFGLIFCS